MTTYNPFGYNFITIPRFDIQFMFSNNSSFILRDKYMRYFALICFIGGLKLSYNFFQQSYYLMNKLYYQLKGVKKSPDSQIVILGYGDSDASHQIAQFYGKLGYNLILVNSDSMLNIKKEAIAELEKIQGIHVQLVKNERIKNTSFGVLESEFSLKNSNISYIFDSAVMRKRTSTSEVPTTSEMTFNIDKIIEYVNVYNNFFDFIKKFSSNTKVYILNYIDKQSDTNHRLFSEMKSSILKVFAETYRDKFTLKSINLYCDKKKMDFTQREVEKIYKSSENDKIMEFNFTG